MSPPPAPSASTRPSARKVVQRTSGRRQGPATRLMSPPDFGKILKPFVFLDLFEYEGPPFQGGMHPHSGIATLTYVTEGGVTYIDPSNITGTLSAGGVEWMQAGRGMWHGGGLDQAGRTRGFQLWIALPPSLELSPATSQYLAADQVPNDGPAKVVLGSYGSATSPILSPSPINYLAVRLKAGESWRYTPPVGHTVLWVALGSGVLSAPEALHHGELAAFEPSNQAVTFTARADSEFVLGSAAPHRNDLVCGHYSVHTSSEALQDAEAHILAIKRLTRRQEE